MALVGTEEMPSGTHGLTIGNKNGTVTVNSNDTWHWPKGASWNTFSITWSGTANPKGEKDVYVHGLLADAATLTPDSASASMQLYTVTKKGAGIGYLNRNTTGNDTGTLQWFIKPAEVKDGLIRFEDGDVLVFTKQSNGTSVGSGSYCYLKQTVS